jgi:NAD-dependent SIR2 family protein deacetylase
MGWTLTGCNFQHAGAATLVHARGNNAAWCCPSCGHPVLFVYRGRGGRAGNPSQCPGCPAIYYLDPQFGAAAEPPRGVYQQPAPTMTIL